MPAMLILAVDTSTPAGSLAALRDGAVVGEVSTWTEETYSSRMFRHLEFLLRELSLEMKDFDAYAVAAGPGSFTGLRVGLTAVKAWAEVHGKRVAAVSGLEAVAAQARATQRVLVPVMDARRAQIYAGVYERDAERLARRGDEVVMQPAEFLALLKGQASGELAFVTTAPQAFAEALAQSEFRDAPVETVSSVLAPWIGRLGYARAQRGELVDALTLDANYIRRSDAELLWRG